MLPGVEWLMGKSQETALEHSRYQVLAGRNMIAGLVLWNFLAFSPVSLSFKLHIIHLPKTAPFIHALLRILASWFWPVDLQNDLFLSKFPQAFLYLGLFKCASTISPSKQFSTRILSLHLGVFFSFYSFIGKLLERVVCIQICFLCIPKPLVSFGPKLFFPRSPQLFDHETWWMASLPSLNYLQPSALLAVLYSSGSTELLDFRSPALPSFGLHMWCL